MSSPPASGSRGLCAKFTANEGSPAFIGIFSILGPPKYRRYRCAVEPRPGHRRSAAGCRQAKCVRYRQWATCCHESTGCSPFDSYTDRLRQRKELVRNAFRDGDCWFNTGDVIGLAE